MTGLLPEANRGLITLEVQLLTHTDRPEYWQARSILVTSGSARKYRSKEGIAVCLTDLGDGRSRLMIDDVVADDPEAQNPVWRHRVFYTQNTYPNDSLDKMSLSDDEYRQIGVAVVARLLAINGRVSK